MSSSEIGEHLSSVDNEQGNRFEDYTYFAIPDYYAKEESFKSDTSIHPKWRRTPRTAADFSETKTSISSCKDSDYEEWLRNYYLAINTENRKKFFSEKQTSTSDVAGEERRGIVYSLFPEFKIDPWSQRQMAVHRWKSTKYWGPDDVRRHWPLRSNVRLYLLFPSIYPCLNLRSRYGRYQSLLNTAAAVPEVTHRKQICSVFKKGIERLRKSNLQLIRILVCDSLCNLKWFDFIAKKILMQTLCNLIRTQYHIEQVYFENADLKRLEGIVLLCALSRSSGDNLKELHMWKMFGYGQCPTLVNELATRGQSSWESKATKFFTRIHFLQILSNFSVLTHLSVNYSYLANKTGDALLSLKAVRNGCLKELRFLCTREERPLLTNPSNGVGGYSITDGVWRRIVQWCPNLRVKFVFLNIPQYENIVVFLSKSIPVSYVYISGSVDFYFEVPWDIDSTLLELRNWYSSTLETLCLHLWRHRDLLDFVIKAKILEEFPNLVCFEFIGVLENVETLNSFCCQLISNEYKLKNLIFWVEEQYTDRKKTEETRLRVAEIRERYWKQFLKNDIDADIRTYAL